MNNDKKFDIFDIIKKITNHDIQFFDNLEDYQIKQIYPFVLMRWLGGSKTALQLKQLNDIVNTTCFQFYRHPKLLYKLLMVSCADNKRVSWIKLKNKVKHNEILNVIMKYYDCSSRDAQDYLKLISNDDILDMAELLGLEKDVMSKLKKELNA